MEITRASFFDKLPEIKDAISNATFLAIDCELSGLNTVSDINAFDTPEQYFGKVRKSSKNFLVIQFGLSAFRYDEDDECFKHQTYNFYIFPRAMNRMMPDQRFLCQASSIEFLSSHGFDFNKLFSEGIAYLNHQQVTKYRTALEEGRKARDAKLNETKSPTSTTTNYISVPKEDKPFIDKVFDEIEAFIKSDEQEHVLPKCNAFLRRLIYQTASGRIDKRASLETRKTDIGDRLLVVTRPKSLQERNKELEAKRKEEDDDFNQAVGFATLMQFIAESRKLIVGHNMMLDVCHSIDKFLTTLPENYEEFKDCVNCFFPQIIDTKYMSSMEPFKESIQSTVLSHLVATLNTDPLFTMPTIEAEDESLSYQLDASKEHEAGYDAYITGAAFITMWRFLGVRAGLGSDAEIFRDRNSLAPYLNRLFLMRVQDSPYIQLDGPDPTLNRDHVVYVTFPKDWKLNDITQLFSPFGNIFVAWIDDSSAYVALHKRDQLAVALSTLSQSDSYSIMTYAQRQSELADADSATRKKHTPSVKKRKSSNSSGEASATKKMMIESICSKKIVDTSAPTLRTQPRKRTLSKTFEENNSWD